MRLSLLNEDVGVVVAKALDYTSAHVTVVPGYCWSLDGFMTIWGDDKTLALPYKGQSLYGLRLNPGNCQPWPFKWSWAAAKGHKGKPDVKYTQEQIKLFVDTTTEEDVIALDARLGHGRTDPALIIRDVVKSVMPAIVIPTTETYTNNFEVIINAPVAMTLLANGYVDNVGLSAFNTKEIMANLAHL